MSRCTRPVLEIVSPVALAGPVRYFAGPMNSNLIRQRWHDGTKPFVFRLSDGTRVPVPHPDFMLMPPGLAQIVVSDKNGRLTRIDPLHVVSLNPLSKAKKRNGKH